MAGIKETHAYIHTLPFAMDCLGHDEDSWAKLLDQRGKGDNGRRVYIATDSIDSLCTWDRTLEGHDFWYRLYTIEHGRTLRGRSSEL